MIIPDDVYPSFTNRDTLDAQVFVNQRHKLFLLSKLAIKYPSIVSWVAINIYAANPEIDYRFEEQFADYAILVKYDWHPSGKGCENASCYETYPKGFMCSYTDPVTMFPSGEFTDVIACQPSCYLKQRTRKLYSAIPYDRSLVDDEKPERCVECDENWLPKKTHKYTRRRLIDGTYDLYDWSTGKTVPDYTIKSNAETTSEEKNDAGYPKTNPDLPQLYWDRETSKCILVNNPIFRTVVEPYWGDKSHSKCRVTNFMHGNDIVFGFRPDHIGEVDPQDLGFLVKNSRTYCRAFNKELQDSGNCKLSLANQILSYTLAGETMLNIVRDAFSGEWACANDRWRPIAGERSRQVDVSNAINASYRKWRANVNLQFVLPPPNVRLSDLGIDVRVTGNRLYWNNVEGIISHFALFQTMEQFVANGLFYDEDDDNERARRRVERSDNSSIRETIPFLALYKNYNRSIDRAIWDALDRDDDGEDNENDDDGDDGSEKNESRSTTSTTTETSERLHERIEEQMQKLTKMYDEKTRRLKARYVSGIRDFRRIVNARDDESLDNDIKRETDSLVTMLRQYEEMTKKKRGGANKRKRDTLNAPIEAMLASSNAQFSVSNFQENEADSISTIFLSYFLKDDDRGRDTNDEEKTRGNRMKRATAGTSGNSNNDLADIADHINEMKNKNPWLEVIKELGIGVAEQILESKFRKILSRVFKRTLLALAKAVSGAVSKSILKVGLRVGMSKLIGYAVSRIATQLLVIAGTFASGVGILVSAIQIIAMLLDLAFLVGWDPGNYKAETDIAVYESIANFFTYSKQQQGGVDLKCDTLMLSLYRTDDSKESDETNQGDGTATERPKENSSTSSTSKTDDTVATATTRASVKRDEKNVSPNDPTKQYRRNLIKRNRQYAAIATTTSSTTSDDDKSKKKSTNEDDDTMNVDDLISRPRWFNKQWPQCFDVYDESQLNIVDDDNIFTMVNGFFYLGHLKYNSFGQEIKRDEIDMELNDTTLGDIIIETDYRDLLTTSAKRDLDARAYNVRVTVNSRFVRYLFAAVIALAALYVFGSIRKSSVVLDIAIFSLIALILVASVLFVLRTIIPLDDEFAEKYSSVVVSSPSELLAGSNAGQGSTSTKTTTTRREREKPITLVDISGRIDSLLQNL